MAEGIDVEPQQFHRESPTPGRAKLAETADGSARIPIFDFAGEVAEKWRCFRRGGC
jgi:hypothetical protein